MTHSSQHSLAVTAARAVALAVLVSATAGPASAQGYLTSVAVPVATSAPARPKPFSALSNSARSVRDSLVAVARAQVGRPYRFGGRTPQRGFDCSGLVQFIMASVQRDFPRTAAQQASLGREVARDTSRLRPGDLVTFGRGPRATHIGIYVGDGRFIHASSVAGRVVESRIDRRAERVKPWRSARRLLPADDEAAQPSASSIPPSAPIAVSRETATGDAQQ